MAVSTLVVLRLDVGGSPLDARAGDFAVDGRDGLVDLPFAWTARGLLRFAFGSKPLPTSEGARLAPGLATAALVSLGRGALGGVLGGVEFARAAGSDGACGSTRRSALRVVSLVFGLGALEVSLA
ncbi:MAG TPA: hypothetical protein VIV60_08930 [Polyangiaceae bacterium]